MPDVIGLSLRQAVSRLAAVGYKTRVEGSGVVFAQEPAAGAAVAPGAVCRLSLRPIEVGSVRNLRHGRSGR